MSAIERCRTAALGGHVLRCDDCTHTQIAYNSCLMGKFRNGELARGCAQSRVSFRPFCSPLRFDPEQGNQLVRRPE
jgi:Transposase zinc-binding domain